MRQILIFLIIIPLIGNTQNYDNCILEYQINSKNGCHSNIQQVKANEIDLYKSYCNESSYYDLSEYLIIKNSDSVQVALFEKYPNNFELSKNGFDFIDATGNRIKFQKLLPKEMKSRKIYEIKAIINEYIIIYVSGYEWWTYHLINTETFKHYTIPGPPVFIDTDHFYGYTDYYGTGEIKFIDTKNEKDVHFVFQESISNVGHSSNHSMGTLLTFNPTKCNDTIYFNITNRY